MSYLGGLSKLRVLLFLVTTSFLVAVAWAGPSDLTSQNSASFSRPTSSAIPLLNNGSLTVNGQSTAGNSSSAGAYGQATGGNTQGYINGTYVQGSVPPTSGGAATPPSTASPSQPTPAVPDYFFPYDPPPYQCKSPFSGAMIACQYCGSVPSTCNPCGGSGGVQVLCAPL